MKQAQQLCSCLKFATPEARVMAMSNTISMDMIACHLLVVRIPFYRASSICSRSWFFDSSCSLSPFNPHHLYLAGLLHLRIFVWKSFERQLYNPRRGGHLPCVAFKEGYRSSVARLPVYKLPSCFYLMAKRNRGRSMQSWSLQFLKPRD